ncbi:hypothetical protein [Actinomadura rugatobispora]|uniref:Uncharacterized protein n=1 Tax=Actinomadura rugatobispora TaxID=1994 RepID=A0ABW1A1A8_9ACTN|nr:hypothetical protein GCM10010200_048880 [Actinomadura rugatobispora]
MTAPTDPTRPIVPGDLFARHQTITGLRALADFIEDNPAVPVTSLGEFYAVYTRTDTDADGRALIDDVAALLDVQVCDDTDRGGHYRASRSFGRITYQAVHIPPRAQELHEARWSYARNIVLDPPTDETTNGAPGGADESADGEQAA